MGPLSGHILYESIVHLYSDTVTVYSTRRGRSRRAAVSTATRIDLASRQSRPILPLITAAPCPYAAARWDGLNRLGYQNPKIAHLPFACRIVGQVGKQQHSFWLRHGFPLELWIPKVDHVFREVKTVTRKEILLSLFAST